MTFRGGGRHPRKHICFIRFVEGWKERNEEVGIVVLERFIEPSSADLNQHVFVALDLARATLHVYSEHENSVSEILKTCFP